MNDGNSNSKMKFEFWNTLKPIGQPFPVETPFGKNKSKY